MMNTGEKIDYMIQCLQVAKAEYEYTADYVANEPTERTEKYRFAGSKYVRLQGLEKSESTAY